MIRKKSNFLDYHLHDSNTSLVSIMINEMVTQNTMSKCEEKKDKKVNFKFFTAVDLNKCH